MLTNEDIYTGTVNPSTNINPKIIGAFYINTKTAKLFVCKDNTINRNVWEMCNPDVVIPEMPEIPVPKFKFEVTLADVCYKVLQNLVWYPNTTDQIWIFTTNHGYDGGNGRICKIGDEKNEMAFENFYTNTIIVPKGYQFRIKGGSQTFQWTKLWL
jgi:hypothetical protein